MRWGRSPEKRHTAGGTCLFRATSCRNPLPQPPDAPQTSGKLVRMRPAIWALPRRERIPTAGHNTRPRQREGDRPGNTLPMPDETRPKTCNAGGARPGDEHSSDAGQAPMRRGASNPGEIGRRMPRRQWPRMKPGHKRRPRMKPGRPKGVFMATPPLELHGRALPAPWARG